MTKFITNEKRLLSKVMNNIIPACDEMYFLVGYFYFSGYRELYKELHNKRIKILIGMEIETNLKNQIIEFDIIDNIRPDSRERIRKRMYEQYVKMYGESNFLDTKENRDAFFSFMEKAKNGTLEIRKTLYPNHAKMYLFNKDEQHNDNGENPGVIITGSSNLSISGLKDREEINIIIYDKNNYEEARGIFDKLWKKAISILDKENYEQFKKQVIEKTYLGNMPSPYEMYIKVLDEYFSIKKNKSEIESVSGITKGRFFNLEYQKDAIREGIEIIKRHNGVIVADVVGLGKSIIASAIAYNLDLPTIIITPPHLKYQWDEYGAKFKIRTAKVFTSGKIEKAYEYAKNITSDKLIIIDEGHKYRNEETKTYGYLHKLCANSKVIILSATPFNNKPQDIYSLVKLFQLPAKSTIRTTNNLYVEFRELIKEHKNLDNKRKKNAKLDLSKEYKDIGNKIRALISPFLIRRSRIDLEEIEEYKKDLSKQKIKFSKVKPPEIMEYNLGKYAQLYVETLDMIYPVDIEKDDYVKKGKGFIGARYKPVDYLKNREAYKKKISKEITDFHLFEQAQRNLSMFMRRLLVHRFESSIEAFRKTLKNIKESNKVILKWIEIADVVPIYKKGNLFDIEQFDDEMESDINEYLFNEELNLEKIREERLKNKIEELKIKGYHFIDIKEIKKAYKEEIEHDIKILDKIIEKWKDIKGKDDPKINHFKEYLKESLNKEPNRKIVVFSTYSDTVDYLYDNLSNFSDKFKVISYTSKKPKHLLEEIIKNFDAGLDKNKQKDDYHVLIATDAISEGYNLHRAGTIFNFDMPYNPTRVIQRVGRINRINKKVFDELYIYNYFPTEIGESEIRIKQISTLKIAIFNALLGSDTQILTKEEELKSYFVENFKKAEMESEEKSWDNEYRNELYYVKTHYKNIYEKSREIPYRTKIQRRKCNNTGGILFAKKGEDYVFGFTKDGENIELITAEKGIGIFKASLNEKSYKISDEFYNIYDKLKQKIFNFSSNGGYTNGEIDAMKNIKFLRDKLVEEETRRKDYLNLLLNTIKDYRALPNVYIKFIKNIDTENYIEIIDNIIEEISLDYLNSIKQAADNIDEGKETILLSEELIDE